MTFEIVSYPTMTTRKVVGLYPSYEAAKLAAYGTFDIAYYEHDADVSYDAADFLTKQGAVYSIQPAN